VRERKKERGFLSAPKWNTNLTSKRTRIWVIIGCRKKGGKKGNEMRVKNQRRSGGGVSKLPSIRDRDTRQDRPFHYLKNHVKEKGGSDRPQNLGRKYEHV